jgi:hypothetical protein
MTLFAVILLYLSFILLGWRASRRQRDGTPQDLLLAGRALPLWLATLTMTATWVDGGYLLGDRRGVYRISLSSGLQGGLFFGLSLILGGLFFARRMREHALHHADRSLRGAVWPALGGGALCAGGAGGDLLERGAAGCDVDRPSGSCLAIRW